MKKSVFTIALVSVLLTISSSTLSAKTESLPKFLYSTTTVEGQIASKEVCKQTETGAYKRHLRYDYTYTDQGLRASCRASRWNHQTGVWENWYLITYAYDEVLNVATLNYALWNKTIQAFDAPSEKAVYQYNADANLLAYAQYEKQTTESHWEVKRLFGLNSYAITQWHQ
ncbi:hypothetical protein M2480_001542 [Parabacteroides sp. PFB2-12]|uniref:DUF3836 domain-containing protein n=1 Tax=unclassified Parabacteroides TaxID=2649774 RepID=UPI002472EBA2|nr:MULTISPECIES: DUF3836 domain-containing protein [unclassified Parabacteroides]MDH6342803.1 hypothetical protein [Parabacteroides sp. PM6-13]MDH6390567.1 hypothetical protein [Parabacteroides sp. PFB2-12]